MMFELEMTTAMSGALVSECVVLPTAGPSPVLCLPEVSI